MIDLSDITIHAGEFRLEDVTLRVPTGKYGVMMGRTGSGKTTILESILGLRHVASGKILLDGRDVTRFKPAARGVGFVPQDGALFSTMTVREQMGLALTIRKVPAADVQKRVDELAELLHITALLERRPVGLSGGERQRVALGRALSFRPRVLCLDEPLSALDDDTRHQMCELLADVRRRTGVTALHVTHNIHEAEALADCVFRIEDGKVETVKKNDD